MRYNVSVRFSMLSCRLGNVKIAWHVMARSRFVMNG